MEIIKNKINWFPGHMKKATDEIKKSLLKVDFIIHVVDARCYKTSDNPELIQYVNSKPIIKIALKQDLSLLKNQDVDFLIGSIKDKNFKQKVINELYKCFEVKIEKLKQKGLVEPKFIGMVIGLPNIGKSSLINFLAPKKTLKVENRPGVTKTQSTRQINNNFFLIDTPGVFLKNITNERDGYVLVLINCIKKEVVELTEVLKFAYDFYLRNHKQELFKKYNLENELDFFGFVDFICHQYKFFSSKNELDYNRAFDLLFLDFSNNKITKINYDIL